MPTPALVLLLASCGVDPSRVTAQVPYARTGDVVAPGESLSFAVVGATRTLVPSADGAADDVIADIQRESVARDLDFVLLTGDYVRRSATSEWVAFGDRWSETLASDRPADNPDRVRVIALAGADEAVGDKALAGYGAAFKGQGPDIGLGRVASWGYFDATIGTKTWRLVFLDTHEKALGSRWKEELFWLPKVVSGDDFDHLIVFLPDPLVTTAQGAEMDVDDNASELLSVIDEHSGMMKLVAVITGGAATNSLILPTGPFGEAHILAGNAGIPGASLLRSRPAPEAGYETIEIEPGFDKAIGRGFLLWQRDLVLSQRVIDDEAAGIYDGSAFPVQGWWIVTLDPRGAAATFRINGPRGQVDIYRASWSRKDGWQPGEVPTSPTGG